MTDLVLFVVIFLVAGAAVLAGNLFLGKLVRPHTPSPEKGTVYECGEPTIGSAWVQFDLRFYVVALLFVIFDVELAFFFPWAVVFGSAWVQFDLRFYVVALLFVIFDVEIAFFFPWAIVFGTANQLADPATAQVQRAEIAQRLGSTAPPDAVAAGSFAQFAFFEMLVFFAILLVGFAYLWKRGDLEWVRSLESHAPPRVDSDADKAV